MTRTNTKKMLRNLAALAAVNAPFTMALSLDVTNQTAIKQVASTVAYDLMKWYTGNITNTSTTIGVLPAPYYWWEAGALWGTMLDYYHLTGDPTYNEVTTQALESQVGPNFDYMLAAQQKDEGNDDQAFWGFATMSAAEKAYPEPNVGYTWLEMTENLWNTQVARWDTANCAGGLRWQIYTFNDGWNYKNSVSNGAFFQLSARLARFTGNQTYLDWANKVYDWSTAIGFVDNNYIVIDGAGIEANCTEPTPYTWTYNGAIFLYGAAVMYNYTGSQLWYTRTQGFLDAVSRFFSPFDNSTNIMYENACETVDRCDNDQYSFKAYLARFMGATSQLAPFTADTIYTYLSTSASAAAQACSGGDDSHTCGQKWYVGGFDGSVGPGQQMSALEVIQNLLVEIAVPPLHASDISTSVSSRTLPATETQPQPTPTKTNAADIRRLSHATLALIILTSFFCCILKFCF
ncbi:hypothetical protein B7494_g1424 [Chlorociboria aeruginascens]|nr:hypothetical protein B7494_g1424 [Chlorociboria aeruginascens]